MAEALLEEGIYRNQFETGISAGGLSAFAGGPRDTWERTLFGGAYHTDDVTASERPKYGALELVRYSDGTEGDIAEVDFFEVLVDVDGTRRKAWLFLMRLIYSGRDCAWIYERQDEISFLDGHVRAFAHFEGVPPASPTIICGRLSSGSWSAVRAR